MTRNMQQGTARSPRTKPLRRAGVLLGTALIAGTVAMPLAAQEVVLRTIIDVPDMDPARINNPDPATIDANIYSQLLKPNAETYEPEPDLAESYDLSEDGLIYTFHLRKDAEFHKGYGPVTAEDVKFTFERLLDPAVRSPFRADMVAVDRIEAVDPQTVKFQMKSPDMSFIRKVIAYRPGYIVSKKAVTELGENFKSSPIGSGPFEFQSWESGAKTILVANENYYAGAPALKKLTFQVVKEDAVALMAQEAGQVDLGVYPSFSLMPVAESSPAVAAGQLKISTQAELTAVYLEMNNDKAPTNDQRVREAISHAINKDDLIDVVYGGLVEKARSVLSPQFFAYKDDVTEFGYDPDKARALLKEAGYADGLKLKYRCFSGATPWTEYAPILQEQLRDVGIQLELAVFDRATHDDALTNGDYDLNCSFLGRPPDPDIVLAYYRTDAIPLPNQTRYSNPEVDKLIEAGRKEADPEKRKAIYEDVQERIARDVPVVMINYRKAMVVETAKLENYFFNSMVKYDMRDVKLAE